MAAGDRSGLSAVRPAGFPGCRRCPYRESEDGDVCLACCARQMPPAPARSCPVCDQALGPGDCCTNDWCGRADRWFSAVWSIGPHDGTWRRVIGEYKYRNRRAWGAVLGRVLLGYLDEHMPWFDDYHLLVPMPAFTGAGGRRGWDHVGEVAAAAALLAGPRWDFCPGLVVKDSETPALTGMARSARRACAEGPLRRALRVPDPGQVSGLRVLVFDDVFTEGSTLREVARALMMAGASEVAGLTLARQPWLRRAGASGSSGPGVSGPHRRAT